MKQYQEAAHKFAAYSDNVHYAYSGLAEECGELSGVVAKFIRKHEGIDHHAAKLWETMKVDAEQCRQRIKGELGDILWFVAEIATINGLDLQDIADYNIAKLTERLKTNTIVGSGETVEERIANAQNGVA